MTTQPDRESVLYAFSVEPRHDRATLERYMKAHPALAEELIDLCSELRLNELLEASPGELADPGLDAAWKEFVASKPAQVAPAAEAVNPFARYRGGAFATLAQSLNVPKSILTALRDRLVPAVSTGFLKRLAEATATAPESIRAYFAQGQQIPTGLAFRSDVKPAVQGRMTFRELIQNTEMTDEQRLLLLRECDEDELA